MKIATTLHKKEIIYKWLLTLRRLWDLPIACNLTIVLPPYEIIIPDDPFKDIQIKRICEGEEYYYLEEPKFIRISQFFRENESVRLSELYSLFLNDIRLLREELFEIEAGNLILTGNEFCKWRSLQERKKETILALAMANDYGVPMEQIYDKFQELRKRG